MDFGLWLAWQSGYWAAPWLHAKFALVLALSGLYGYLSVRSLTPSILATSRRVISPDFSSALARFTTSVVQITGGPRRRPRLTAEAGPARVRSMMWSLSGDLRQPISVDGRWR